MSAPVQPVRVRVLRANGAEDTVALSSWSLVEMNRRWPGTTANDEGKIIVRDALPYEKTLFALWVTEEDPDVTEGDTAEKAFREYCRGIQHWADLPKDEADPTPPAVGDVD